MPSHRPEELERVLATIGGPAPIVERHRLAPLFERLDGVRLVLVRAPAGYGKTILLRGTWRRLLLAEARAAWTTLAPQDDDAARIRVRIEDVLERASAAGAAGRLIVFVDGIDEIRSADAEAALGAAIASLPDEATLVLASRRLPEIGIGQLRLRGELREITRDDLRFDLDETRALFRSAGRSPADVVLARFLRLTEGWPAALRLAATGASSADDPDPTSCCPEVAEYLAESVLARQPADLRRFLLRTCVPSRLTPELCDALTGGDDGMRMLDRLERDGSFLVRLDGRPRWFRYHRLFRAFLREELARDAEERPAELQRRAAAWLADHGYFLEAAEHAFEGGDHELAAKLLDDGALASIRRGESAAVLRWTRRLSPERLRAHPRFALAAAWARLFRRDADGARSALAAVDRGRARKSGSPGLDDEVLCLEAFVVLAEDRLGELATIALDRRSRLSADGTFEHGATCNLAALGLAAIGRFDEARRLALEAKASHRRAGSAFGEAFSLAIQGAVLYAQGSPAEALATYRRAEEIPRDAAGRAHARAVVATPIAEALYELDLLDEAETVLRGARELPADFAWVDASGNPHLVRARILAARGELEAALHVLEDGEFEAMLRSFTRMATTMRWEEVRLLTRAGRTAEATAKANAIDADGFREHAGVHHAASEDEARDLTQLRLAIRTGQARTTAAILATEAADARRRGRMRRWLKAQTLHAEALDALGERRAALRALRDAILFGASRGFVRSFADEGAALVPLLEELREARPVGEAEGTEVSAEDLERILAAARGVRAEAPCAAALLIAEPLSPRERELLVLVDAGLSNRSIARRLCVSENTVKTHVRHIYGKLHVTSRTAALAYARRQGLLS